MTKIKKVELSDFDFSKKIQKTPTFFLERLVVTSFVIVFGSLLYLVPAKVNTVPVVVLEPISQVSTQYPDYVITPEDKKFFQSIFTYDSDYILNHDKTVRSFQDQIRSDDILNNPFELTKDFHVSSKILAIEPANKTEMVAATGNPNLDFVDVVVQKTYTKGKDVFYEQQMVNLTLDNHKIVDMKTNRMID